MLLGMLEGYITCYMLLGCWEVCYLSYFTWYVRGVHYLSYVTWMLRGMLLVICYILMENKNTTPRIYFIFNFPRKVGEIIMKYFHSAFMKFTVKDYTTKWQALRIGIMMGCAISSFLFVLAMELVLRGAANTLKGVMKNEHRTLPPSRAFMDDITILVPSQIAADGLLQRYYNLFTWARMKAKSKKSQSLLLIRGSVREIHFKIGGLRS